jgi:preprotein translocase subunit SecG
MAIVQIIVAIAIIVLILLQERSAGITGLLGGEGGSGVYQTRRGMEKVIFRATIVLSVVFVVLAVYQLIKS